MKINMNFKKSINLEGSYLHSFEVVYEIARTCNIFAINPINTQNGEQLMKERRESINNLIN